LGQSLSPRIGTTACARRRTAGRSDATSGAGSSNGSLLAAQLAAARHALGAARRELRGLGVFRTSRMITKSILREQVARDAVLPPLLEPPMAGLVPNNGSMIVHCWSVRSMPVRHEGSTVTVYEKTSNLTLIGGTLT
jgi:hypothetical protein